MIHFLCRRLPLSELCIICLIKFSLSFQIAGPPLTQSILSTGRFPPPLDTTVALRTTTTIYGLPSSFSIRNEDVNHEEVGEYVPSPSTLRTITFCLPKSQEPDLLCELLMELGACATSLTDAYGGTSQEQALYGEQVVLDTPFGGVAILEEHQIWNLCNVSAIFPDSIDLEGIMNVVQSTLLATEDDGDNRNTHPLHFNVQVIPNRDWVVHVQQSWKPVLVGRYLLKFPWHTEADLKEALSEKKEEDAVIVLELQAGLAFGTGEHATTQLCLHWIDSIVSEQLDLHPHPFEVLDYGSGSGVLGLAACALDKSRVSAVGVDIDIDACRIANDNAHRNSLPMRNYLPPPKLLYEQKDGSDDESKSLLMKAHRQAELFRQKSFKEAELSLMLPLELDERQYPIVVANILAGPLVALAPSLMQRVMPGGKLGLSGVLQHQVHLVLNAYGMEGLENARVEEQIGDWVLITGTKRI